MAAPGRETSDKGPPWVGQNQPIPPLIVDELLRGGPGLRASSHLASGLRLGARQVIERY